jgi:hypothetical protein
MIFYALVIDMLICEILATSGNNSKKSAKFRPLPFWKVQEKEKQKITGKYCLIGGNAYFCFPFEKTIINYGQP